MNISLLGLFVNERKLIKEYFDARVDANALNWVTANDTNLEVLVIRAAFLTTTEIINFLQKIDRSVCVLSTAVNVQEEALSNKLNIPVLNITATSPQEINRWMAHIPATLLPTAKPAVPKSIQKISASTTLKSEPMIEAASAEQMRQSVQKNIDRLLKQLLKFPHIVEFSNGHIRCWIDNRLGLVYFEQNITDFHITIEGHRWQIFDCKNPDFTTHHSIDLHTWLWINIWGSLYDFAVLIPPNKAFKLTIWPNFCRAIDEGRNEAISLTAALQQNTLDFNQLMEKTKLSEQHVSKYLYIMQLIGHVKTVDLSQRAPELRIVNPAAQPNLSARKNFLKRLKTFMGI